MEPEPNAWMSPPSSSRVAAAAAPPQPPLTPVRCYILDDEEFDDDDELPAYPLSPSGEPHPPCQSPQRQPPLSPRAWQAAAAAFAPEPIELAFDDLDFSLIEYGLSRQQEPPILPAALEHDEMVRAKAAADALHHYNADPGNEVKYEATRVTGLSTILTDREYRHINFFARAKPRDTGESDDRERFFFAEVLYKERGPWVPTCLCSLDADGDDQLGGVACELFADSRPWLVPVDYCLMCSDRIKHPKDGASYVAGHPYITQPRRIPDSRINSSTT